MTLYVRASAVAAIGFILTIAPRLMPADVPLDAGGRAMGRDFVNVWNASRLAVAGQTTILFDVQAYWDSLRSVFGAAFPIHNWSYPPHALILFAPFGQMPYLVGLAVWIVVTMATCLAAVSAGLSRDGRAGWLALFALSPASVINVGFGQNGHLSAAFLLGGLALMERRPWIAGVLFGLLTIKPHLGVLIPFACLAVGAWRPMVSAALTALALVAASVAFFGLESWRLYVGVTTGVQTKILTDGLGLFVTMMPTVYQSVKLAFGPEFAAPLQAAVSLVVAPVAIVAFRRSPDAAGRALLLVSATLLVLPYAFNYDLVMLAGAIVWWLATREKSQPLVAAGLVAAWVTPVFVMPLGAIGAPLGPFAIAAAFVIAAREAFAAPKPVAVAAPGASALEPA